MKKKIVAVLVLCLALSACADAIPATTDAPSGFFTGLWHGFIILPAFIISLFSDKYGIYEAVNNGWPYNLGFLLGTIMFLGGASSSK
jgi:hypothetical protein